MEEKVNEIKKRLKLYAAWSDKEVAHYEADERLCELLIELGYIEVVELFQAIDKWYA